MAGAKEDEKHCDVLHSQPTDGCEIVLVLGVPEYILHHAHDQILKEIKFYCISIFSIIVII